MIDRGLQRLAVVGVLQSVVGVVAKIIVEGLLLPTLLHIILLQRVIVLHSVVVIFHRRRYRRQMI